MPQRQPFTLKLTCQHCGTSGFIIWEENRFANPEGSQRRLIEIHGEFHSEVGRANSGDPMIICNVCDQIQPD